MTYKCIQTAKGAVAVGELGLILPHEHLFTDLRGPLVSDYALAEPEAVAQVMSPYLAEAHWVGVTDDLIRRVTVTNPGRAFSFQDERSCE